MRAQDNCGSSKNVTEYARQFNLTGRPVRIEACHNDVSKFDDDGNFVCPMNQYRSGGDIGPNFGSVIGEAYGTIGHNDLDVPMSRPGCWACECNHPSFVLPLLAFSLPVLAVRPNFL